MSTIDPFAFGKGLEAGQQFNPPPDPLKAEQVKAAVLDRQMKAQQISAQTMEANARAQQLVLANQQASDDYNSIQARSRILKADPNASVETLESGGVLPKHVDEIITGRKNQSDINLKNAGILKDITGELIDAYSLEPDVSKHQALEADIYRRHADAGDITIDQANKAIQKPPDPVDELKAQQKAINDAFDRESKKNKDLEVVANTRKANAEAAAKETEAGALPQSRNDLISRLGGIFANNAKDPNYQKFLVQANQTPEVPAVMDTVLKDAVKVRDQAAQDAAIMQRETALIPLREAADIDKEKKLLPLKTAAELDKEKQAAIIRANEPTQRLKDQVTDSAQALQQTALVRQLVAAHPEIIGPVMGRLAKGSVSAGTSFGFATPEQENAAARLQTNLGNLLLNEARVASPGRSNAQVMQILKDQSAAMGKNPAMIEGALKGVEDRAQMAIQEGRDKGINTPGAAGAPKKITDQLIQANMRANPSATRQQIVDELKKHNYVE